MIEAGIVNRAMGCWLGQLSGDALGSMVESETQAAIAAKWPDGLRTMDSSPHWNTAPGQPTDDSELAMELAYALIDSRLHFDRNAIAHCYRNWMETDPFSCGKTIATALKDHHSVGFGVLGNHVEAAANPRSEANGALMRQSTLGIWGVGHDVVELAECARLDARLTHPHVICQEASAVYVTTIAQTIAEGWSRDRAYQFACEFQTGHGSEDRVGECLRAAADPGAVFPPYSEHTGHVLLALHNAFYQLLHRSSLEEVVVSTVALGGDTDTNAAIAGALAGAVYGELGVPAAWRDTIAGCRPSAESGASRPRPERYWPANYAALVNALLPA